MHLERLAVILEIVGQKGEASVGEICAHSDIPKPTAYRLVNDLADAGLLDSVARGRYAVGNRLRRVTEASQSDRLLLETIAPALREMADAHGVACFVSRLRGRSVEIIHVETPRTGVSFLHPGLGKRPLHACSCSKAIAAFSPDIADAMTGRMKAYTEFTLTDPDHLGDELERIRRIGYAECVEEIERGMCSVAAPLGANGQPPTLSIGATGSVRVFTPVFRARMGDALILLAGELSDRISCGDRDRRKASA